MTDLPDLDLDLDPHGSGLGRAIAAIARAVWWVVWEFGCEWILWSVGWCCWRVASLGRFPSTGLADAEQAAWWEALLVMLTGLGALGAAIWMTLDFL